MSTNALKVAFYFICGDKTDYIIVMKISYSLLYIIVGVWTKARK